MILRMEMPCVLVVVHYGGVSVYTSHHRLPLGTFIVRISGGPCPHYQTFIVYKLGVHARKSCRLIHSAPFTRQPPSDIPVAVQSTLFHTTIYRKKKIKKKNAQFYNGSLWAMYHAVCLYRGIRRSLLLEV